MIVVYIFTYIMLYTYVCICSIHAPSQGQTKKTLSPLWFRNSILLLNSVHINLEERVNKQNPY